MKFLMLINVKMPTIVGTLTFISMIKAPLILAVLLFMSSSNFMHSLVDYEDSFITFGPEHTILKMIKSYPMLSLILAG